MNFADEDYRRLYIRRTVTNRRLGWEGRAVMHELLYEFDRAGVFEFGEDAARDIADLVELPLDVVQRGLSRLLATRTWVMSAGRIVWTHFVEAQNCPRSDRLRQQELRERRRDDALRAPSEPAVVPPSTPPIAKPAELPSGVTPREPLSRESRNVTPNRADPNLTEQSDPERARPVDSGPNTGPDPEPATITFLPEGWEPAPAFVAEATAAGITPGELGEAVKYWAGRKLGGEWRSPEAFFRGKFASIRTRAEKVRFVAHQERASPGARASPAPESVRATGWGQHLPSEIVEFAVKHALDAHKTAGAMLRSGELDRVTSHAEANRLLAKRLGAEAKARKRTEAA